jgi:hypothetical protein
VVFLPLKAGALSNVHVEKPMRHVTSWMRVLALLVSAGHAPAQSANFQNADLSLGAKLIAWSNAIPS